MILAQDSEGNYIKTANTSHKVFLTECLSDWRPRIVTEEEIENALLYSENFDCNIFQNIVFDYPCLVIIYCDSSHAEIGAYQGGFTSTDGLLALNLDYAALSPAHRGQGHHSKFFKILVWFLHRHIKIDRTNYELLKDVPQMVNLAPKYNQEIYYHDKTSNGLIEKFGAAFTYDAFYSKYDEYIANTVSFSSSIPEISYESRARATNKHKLKKFNLVWNIEGGMKVTRRD